MSSVSLNLVECTQLLPCLQETQDAAPQQPCSRKSASPYKTPHQADSLQVPQPGGSLHKHATSDMGALATTCSATDDSCVQPITACTPPDCSLTRSYSADPMINNLTAAGQVLDGSQTGPGPTAAASGGKDCTANDYSFSCDPPDSTVTGNASACAHPDCPQWLPEQLSQVQLSYAEAEYESQLVGTALLGQRVAFVLVEDFQQTDSRNEIDTLLAGVHSGQ